MISGCRAKAIVIVLGGLALNQMCYDAYVGRAYELGATYVVRRLSGCGALVPPPRGRALGAKSRGQHKQAVDEVMVPGK